jgi:hypothetical protein
LRPSFRFPVNNSEMVESDNPVADATALCITPRQRRGDAEAGDEASRTPQSLQVQVERFQVI